MIGVRPESLEARILPALRVWDGGALLNDNWSDPKNWEGDVAPQNGDDLKFPIGINDSDKSTVNDFPSGRLIGNIELIGGGYTLSGNQITLKSGANIVGDGNGTITVALNVRFNPGDHQVVADDLEVVLTGVLSNTGTGTLTYQSLNGGSFRIGGAGSNTYNQPVFIPTGRMRVEKSGSADAFAGAVTIGDEAEELAEVTSVSSSAFKDGVALTVIGGIDGRSSLRLSNNSAETFGRLTLVSGAILGNGASKLVLKDRVDLQANASGIDPILNDVVIDLGSTSREFSVATGVDASTSDIRFTNGGLRKTGGGGLALAGGPVAGSFTGGLRIEGGFVSVEGNSSTTPLMPSGLVTASPGTKFRVNNAGGLGDTVAIDANQADVEIVFSGIEKLKSLAANDTRVFLNGGLDLQVSGAVTFVDAGSVGILDATLTVNGLLTMTRSLVNADGRTIIANGGVVMTEGDLIVGQLLVDQFFTTLASSETAVLFGDVGINRRPGARTPFKFNIANGAAETDLFFFNGSDLFNNGFVQKIEKTGLGRMVMRGSQLQQAVNVTQGSLEMNGNGAQTNFAVTAATFSGIAQFGSLSAGSSSVIAPGFEVDAITGVLEAADIRLNGSRLVLDIDGLDPGDVDSLKTPTLSLQNNPTLDVRLNTNVSLGDTFVLVSGLTTPVTGRFKAPTGNVLEEGESFDINGRRFTISYQANGGTAVAIARGNNAPAFVNREATSPFEGESAVVSGHITELDLEDTFFLDVDWGDGSAPETFEFPPGTPRDISVNHVFDDDGIYTAHLLWRDEHGAFNEADLAIEVKNADPAIELVDLPLKIDVGDPLNLAGVIRDAGLLDAHRITVDWGDGQVDEIDFAAGESAVNLQHIYQARGRQRIKLVVVDDDGGRSVYRVAVRVDEIN